MNKQSVIAVAWVVTWLGLAGGRAETTITQQTAPEQIEFKYPCRVGDTARQKIVVKNVGGMKLTSALPEQKFAQTFEQIVVSRCTQIKPDGSIVLELTMPYIAMKMNFAGFEMNFDSATYDPKAPQDRKLAGIGPIFMAMTEIKFTAILSPQGEPLEVQGLEEGVDKILKAMGPGLGSMVARKYFDNLKQYLGDEMILDQLKSGFRMAPPGRKFRVGDQWSSDWQVSMKPMNVAFKGHGEYRLLGIEEFRGHPCGKISVKETLDTVAENQAQSRPGEAKSIMERMHFRMKVGDGEGIAYVDYKTGELVNLRSMQRMEMEISFKADPQAEQEDMKPGIGLFTQSMSTSLTIDLLEGEESTGGDQQTMNRPMTDTSVAP